MDYSDLPSTFESSRAPPDHAFGLLHARLPECGRRHRPCSARLLFAFVRAFTGSVTLAEELANLPEALVSRLTARGFDKDRLLSWAASMNRGTDARNRLQGRVEPPIPADVKNAPVPGDREFNEFRELGRAALSRGEVALCVLSGGMATRMGGVVKALVDVFPGTTFLDLRLAENRHLEKTFGARVPLWLMTSEATNRGIEQALGDKRDGYYLATFEQCVSLRLSEDGLLFRDNAGAPSVYATGHGDLPDSLRKSGLLERFLQSGGKYVWIANLDNLGATIDETLLGFHIAAERTLGNDLVSVELVDKVGSDRGGGPVRHNGRLIITEEFRLPLDFDPKAVPVFNTNTFLLSAESLSNVVVDWTYVEVRKNIDSAPGVQFERLLGEITTALTPHLIRVPREGLASRFLPVKDVPELERRRVELLAIAKARGMLG